MPVWTLFSKAVHFPNSTHISTEHASQIEKAFKKITKIHAEKALVLAAQHRDYRYCGCTRAWDDCSRHRFAILMRQSLTSPPLVGRSRFQL